LGHGTDLLLEQYHYHCPDHDPWEVTNEMYAFYSDMQYSCLFGELEFEPDAVFKTM
jgi:hypothetical protein